MTVPDDFRRQLAARVVGQSVGQGRSEVARRPREWCVLHRWYPRRRCRPVPSDSELVARHLRPLPVCCPYWSGRISSKIRGKSIDRIVLLID